MINFYVASFNIATSKVYFNFNVQTNICCKLLFFFDRTAVYGEKKLLCCFNCKTLGDL